jgi:RNA polymerase sigma factor (sigma-70 family)
MDDQTLLSQYVMTRDAVAFEELTRRYSGLVRGVCIRLLGNPHDAEEAAQECFFELARHAAEVHTSLGGWLHRAATSRSLNLLRSRARRKVRERTACLDVDSTTTENEFAEPDFQRLIQGAIKELPDNLRLPMVLHYVEGQSQRDVAVRLGVNQSTISRRMRDALRQLRDKLTQAGYAATTPAMMVFMQEHATAGATESAIADIVVSGTSAKVAGSTTLIGSLKGGVTALLPILSFLLFGGWMFLFTSLCLGVYIARYRPIWVSEVMASFGVPDLYRQPTFFLARWEWTTPPDDWKAQMRASFLCSIFFAGLTLTFAFGTVQPPWGTVVMGLAVASVFLVHALRIGRRVTMGNGGGYTDLNEASFLETASTALRKKTLSSESTWNWFDAVQLISIGLSGVAIAVFPILWSQEGIVWPAMVMCSTISIGMLIAGVRLCRRLLMNSRFGSDRSKLTIKKERTLPGTRVIIVVGATIVAALSIWIFSNPATVSRLSLSLAAIQTSMLGWIVYRIAAFHNVSQSQRLRCIVVAILVGSFVLNSGICLANWLPMELGR